MAAIAGYSPITPFVADNTNNISSDLESHAFDSLIYSYLVTGVNVTSYDYMTRGADNYAVSGRRAISFKDDFYFRVHVTPVTLDLGNLTSAKTRSVYVWNAHFDQKLLSSVNQVTSDVGISLIEPEAAPTYFAANEERIYTVDVELAGPPVINSGYSFSFEGETPQFNIIGRRVLVWYFRPQSGHTEELEWKTVILQTYSQESRSAYRSAPRQIFNYEFVLTERQFSRAKAISSAWYHRVYGIPVWSESTRLGFVADGATVLNFDTTDADYRNDDVLLIWQDDDNFLPVETDVVSPTSITLKDPVAREFTSAFVMPLRYARTLTANSFERSSGAMAKGKVSFTVIENIDLTAASSYPQHLGFDVLTDKNIIVDSPTEKISMATDVFDNGSAAPSVNLIRSPVENKLVLGRTARTKEELWDLRVWLHSRKGKQRSFWLPTWNRDIEITLDATSVVTQLTIVDIGFSSYYSEKDIMIAMKSGEVYFYHVDGSSDNGDGTEIIYLPSSLGVDITVADVDMVCFLNKVCLDTDKVKLKYDDADGVEMSAAVREVPA